MNEPIMYHLYKFAQGKSFSRVLNIGSGDQHKRMFPDNRTFFSSTQYIGIDLVKGNDSYVDMVMDAKNMTFPSDHFDCIICTETLEHIDDIYKAADGIKRVLAPGGWLFVSIPFLHPFHNYPGDFWRITPSGLDFLFRGLKRVEGMLIGNKKNPNTVIIIYRKV